MRQLLLPTAYFLAYFLGILIAQPTQPFNDPGSLWHIRVGEWIVQHRAFPWTDPFTFTFADKTWVPQQWGGELVLYSLYQIAGFDSIAVFLAGVTAGVGTWLTCRFVATGWHPIPAVLMVGGGLCVCAFHYYARPHMATLGFMAFIAALIVDTDRGTVSPRRWWLVLPVAVIWTNIHGGVVGGLATLGVATAGWTIWYLLKKPSPVRCPLTVVWFGGIVVAGALLTLVNPFGLQMHVIWFSLIDSKILKEVISEHMPLSLSDSSGKAVAGFGLVYLLMLLGTLPRWPRVSWFIPAVWFVLSLTSIRHGPIFCVVALVVIGDLLPETLWFRYLKTHGNMLIRPPRPSEWSKELIGVFAGILLICFVLQAARVPVPLIVMGEGRLNPKSMPLEMVGPLQEYAASVPAGTFLFNDANLGGFVLHFAPTLKTFMDDRCELCGDKWMRHYVHVMSEAPEEFEEWSAKWKFDRVLLGIAEKKEDRYLLDGYLAKQQGWEEVFRCKAAVMYRRK